MLVVFKSKAAADIHMYPEHAKLLLELLGKPFDAATAPRGIITAEQVPQALATLKNAADSARAADRKREADEARSSEPPSGTDALPVGLAQRAFPLIEMLERAQKKQADVVWGV